MKSLRIDPDMKEKWPQTRVGCLQYQVKVEKKKAQSQILWDLGFRS